MLRPLDIAMIAGLIAAGSWTFKIKHDSEAAMERVAKLERQIAAEREAIDLLRADWSLLTSPDRLQALAERHSEELELSPIDPGHIVTIDDIPFRPPQPSNSNQGFAGSTLPRLGSDLDTVTGSIDRMQEPDTAGRGEAR